MPQPSAQAPVQRTARDILQLVQERHAEIMARAPADGQGRSGSSRPRQLVRRNARLPIINEDETINVASISGQQIVQSWFAIKNVPKNRKYLLKNADGTFAWTGDRDGSTKFNTQEDLIEFLEGYISSENFDPAVEMLNLRIIQQISEGRTGRVNRTQVRRDAREGRAQPAPRPFNLGEILAAGDQVPPTAGRGSRVESLPADPFAPVARPTRQVVSDIIYGNDPGRERQNRNDR